MRRRYLLAALAVPLFASAWVMADAPASPTPSPTVALAPSPPPAPIASLSPDIQGEEQKPRAMPSSEPSASVSASTSPSPVPEASSSPEPTKKHGKGKDKGKGKNKKAKELPKKAKAPKSKLPPLLQEIEDKYSKSETLSAEFTQTNYVAAMDQKKLSSGHMQIKRPDKIRWETVKPDPNLLVSDGKIFWFYTPPFDAGEHGQVMEKRTNEVQSKLAHALLSGRFSIAKDMKIQRESENSFALIPKKGSAGTVTNARIEISVAEKLINKVVLEHKGGNRSEITLTHIELGKPLEDKLFIFEAPANTDKVSQ